MYDRVRTYHEKHECQPKEFAFYSVSNGCPEIFLDGTCAYIIRYCN